MLWAVALLRINPDIVLDKNQAKYYQILPPPSYRNVQWSSGAGVKASQCPIMVLSRISANILQSVHAPHDRRPVILL
jgi:hypothetical protein